MKTDSLTYSRKRARPITSKNYYIKGHRTLSLCFALGQKRLVLLKARRGFIMCGYLNLKVADAFGDAACIVKGVSTVGQLLAAPITNLTQEARRLGVHKGMLAKEAIVKLS